MVRLPGSIPGPPPRPPDTAQERTSEFCFGGAKRYAYRTCYAARILTGWVQCEHRRASMGISLRHSGHFLVVGSGGFSPRFMRATSALTGRTTRKYTAAAIRTNEMQALMKLSSGNATPRTVNWSDVNFSPPPVASLMRGFRKAEVSPPTTPANAAPITTPTAISTTFPRRMNFLKPSSIDASDRIGAKCMTGG